MEGDKCEFESDKEYYNVEDNKVDYFRCENPQETPSKLCKFHDKNYWKGNVNEIKQLFFEKIKKSTKKGHEIPLNCIGYHLPCVEIDYKIFSRSVYFNEAKFFGNISFNVTFFNGKGNVDFTHAEFQGAGDVNFKMAHFRNDGNIIFSCAKFNNSGSIEFRGTQFDNTGLVSFAETQFENKGKITFIDSEFNGKRDVIFSEAKFKKLEDNIEKKVIGTAMDNREYGDISFRTCKFNNKGDVIFGHTEFGNNIIVNLFRSQFNNTGLVVFLSSDLKKCKVEFQEIHLKNPENIILHDWNISKWSFLKTDITRIKLNNDTNLKNNQNKFKIREENDLELNLKKDDKTVSQTNLESILSIYRNFRENFEYNLQYDQAGKAFIREMEIKRKYKQDESSKEDQNQIKRRNLFARNFLVTGVYGRTSRYGEDLTRPASIVAGSIVLASLFFVFDLDLSLEMALWRSLQSFSPSLEFNEKPTIIDYFLNLLLFPLAVSVFISLRRKLERRFRH